MNPRSYQIELYEKAKGENVIIKLNTGSGKTFIASMLIRDYLNTPDNKKTFLLVKNSSLAYQHFDYLKKYLFLNNEIGIFHGQMENSWVDNWSKDKWSEKLGKHKIIVMTARVFLDIILHNKFSINDVCFLIFDEVHHCAKSDDYAQISQHISRSPNTKVLGLTACLIQSVKNIKDIQFHMLEFEMKLGCKIITSLDAIHSDFSENIKEDIITFVPESFSNIIQQFEDTIKEINEYSENTVRNFLDENPVDSLHKYLNECISVLKSLGLIPCKLILDIFLKDLVPMLSDMGLEEQSLIRLTLFISCLTLVKDQIDELCEPGNLNCSAKVTKLIKFIYDFKPKKTSILIFVSERIHALALNEFFLSLPEFSDLFSFIKSEFIVGHTMTNYPKKLQMNSRKQNEILKQYREKKFNILIGTNVVEEGLDIPHCNVVIKFDPPQDFRSYVQSKGRARADDSYYVIFSSEEHKTRFQLNQYRETNIKINEMLKTKVISCESDDDSLENNSVDNRDTSLDYAPYGNDGPRITINSASSVLNRYIGKLRCNSLSELKIHYKSLNTDSSFYQISLLLPMPAPLVDEIIGEPSSNKKRAKQLANLKACKLLHEYGELDINLLPTNRYTEHVIDSKDTEILMNINEYKKYTAKKLSPVIQVNQNFPDILYLYSITYSPSVFLQLGLSNVSVFDTPLSLGILFPKPIHGDKRCIKFPIFLVGGKSIVEITFEKSIKTTYTNWMLFLKFHEYLFTLYSKRIRKFDPNICYNPQDSSFSFIVTVLKDSEIDFGFIKKFVEKPEVIRLKEKEQKTWVGSIVRPTYLVSEFGAFVITEVCSKKNALSPFPGSNKTYDKFYHDKFDTNLVYSEKLLPLVKAQRLTTLITCVNKEKRKLKDSRKLKRIDRNEFYFVPSLIECISLPAGLWTQLCIFPTLHYRLNQIFALEEFAKEINFIDLEDNSECLEIDFDVGYNILNIESKELNTDMAFFIQNIFPCFVSKACNDRTNLEQYEILGDSFLKYITSKYIYHFSKPTDNEGKLTQNRSRLISNSNLFKLGIKKGLERFFFFTNFDPRINYLPPYFIETGIESKKKKRTAVSFKNKNLADCVEAIIGSVLVHYGMDYATKFLLWLGLSLYPEDQMSLDVKPLTHLMLDTRLVNLTIPCCILELETILNYEFKYKAYAVQAITHPTSIENRKFSCYQRLEFLGDSVIDFLVTVYIMLNNQQIDSGKITNLRSALVNNNTFAYLSVKWGFHKFLNHFDRKMHSLLPVVAEKLLENQLESHHAFLKESEQYRVIVKVLGDIFESICGAVFLDSNHNLETVWEIFNRLMEEPLKKFSANTPRNKISMLHERYPNLKCCFETDKSTNLIKMTASLSDGNEKIVKIAKNKRLCKLALAEEVNI